MRPERLTAFGTTMANAVLCRPQRARADDRKIIYYTGMCSFRMLLRATELASSRPAVSGASATSLVAAAMLRSVYSYRRSLWRSGIAPGQEVTGHDAGRRDPHREQGD